MDEKLEAVDRKHQPDTTSAEPTDGRVEEASSKYLASWNHLVSTTNWEKGGIINEWREALRLVNAPVSSYSDEAWSRRVGNVSPQHVGRLRRIYERFHKTHKQYDGLCWSHFQAALDWDDAEMWLEGAVQSSWSVSAMRQNRWEAIGGAAEAKPRDADIILAELDEDVHQAGDAPAAIAAEKSVMVQPVDDDPHEPNVDRLEARQTPPPEQAPDVALARREPTGPFEDLPELPGDLREAVEAMRSAILHHKRAGWQDVRRDDVLAVLSALKQLALAPSEP